MFRKSFAVKFVIPYIMQLREYFTVKSLFRHSGNFQFQEVFNKLYDFAKGTQFFDRHCDMNLKY